MGAAPGFFGKLLVFGDFVTRRLPREFVEPWDLWLQGSIAASREQLGDGWLEVYLTSPIWRFGLAPGVCGTSGWAGVLMPSVDKVGRHFPLTLAAPVEDIETLARLFGSGEAAEWFATLEELALTGLEDGFDLETFDRALAALAPPRSRAEPRPSILPQAKSALKMLRHVGMSSLRQAPGAFLDLSASVLRQHLPQCTLWCSAGSEQMEASLLLLDGLPPIAAHVAFMTGNWRQGAWAVESKPVKIFDQAPGGIEEPVAVASRPDGVVESPPATGNISLIEHFFATEPLAEPTKSGSWAWRSWGLCVVGMKRKINEDAMVDRPETGLWAVADGMGGHHAGDVASQTVATGLAAVQPSDEIGKFAAQVEQVLQNANTRLFELAAESGDENQVIGSTVVVLLAAGSRCAFLWAGDSRLYLFRQGVLSQLTQDHSLYDDLVNEGLMSSAALAESVRCNIITRAVGANEALVLSSGQCEARSGDLFLLCSDGLDKELSHEEISAVFQSCERPEIARRLVEKAEERGARDNVTVVVVEALGG